MLSQSLSALYQPVAARCVPLHIPSKQIARGALWAAGKGCRGSPIQQVSARGGSHRVQALSTRMGDVFFLDEFAIRQWDDASYSGTRIRGDKQAFVDEIHKQHGQACQMAACIRLMESPTQVVGVHVLVGKCSASLTVDQQLLHAGSSAGGWLRPIL